MAFIWRHSIEETTVAPYPQGDKFYPIKSVFWKGWKVVKDFVLETPLKMGIFLVGGVIFQIFFPPLALPFWGIAAAHFVTRLVVKIMDHYHVEGLDNVKIQVYKLTKKIPLMQLITFIFALVIGYFVPIAGLIIALALGVISGLIIGMELSKQLQRAKAKEQFLQPGLPGTFKMF